jgi:phage tail-like protein
MSPTGGRNNTIQNFRFRVEIDGIIQAGFSEVIMPDVKVETIEYREGTEPTHFRKLSGLTKYGNIVLKWGITDNMELYNWLESVKNIGASGNRKNMAIILADDQGNNRMQWNIIQAWPVNYRITNLNAQTSEIAIEMIEVAFIDFNRAS